MVEVKSRNYFRQEGCPGLQHNLVTMQNQNPFLKDKAIHSDNYPDGYKENYLMSKSRMRSVYNEFKKQFKNSREKQIQFQWSQRNE